MNVQDLNQIVDKMQKTRSDNDSEFFEGIMEEPIDIEDIEKSIAYFEKQNIKLTELEENSIRNSKNLSELFSVIFVITYRKERKDDSKI